jgi:hypothetical protein
MTAFATILARTPEKTTVRLTEGQSTRTNVITNPSFETDTAGWSVLGGATIARVTTDHYSGAAACSLTGSVNGRMQMASAYATGVAAGQVWTGSAYVKGAAGEFVTLNVWFYNVGTYVAAPGDSLKVALSGAWQQIGNTVTAPAGVDRVRIQVMRNNVDLLVDAVMLEKSPGIGAYVEGTVATSQTGALIREDINGRYEVRTPAGTFPLAFGQQIDIDDYEASLAAGTTVTYSTINLDGTTGSSTSVAIPPDLPGWSYLTCPLHPGLGMVLATGPYKDQVIIRTLTEQRASATSIHQVVDRPDAVPVLRELNGATGTMDLSCPSLAVAQAVLTTLEHAEVWMLRQSDQLPYEPYFVVTGTRLDHSEDSWLDPGTGRLERRWSVGVDFTTVLRPTGNISTTADWDYDAVLPYGSYVNVRGTFPNYGDLIVGPV